MDFREKLDLRASLTVFLISSGEATRAAALDALRAQDCLFVLKEIRDVAPMDRAFQAMIDTCQTEYYIQVDGDMILYPHAVREMHRRFQSKKFTSSFDGKSCERRKTAMLFFPLWDCHLERQITGIKIYQHAILRNFPYESDFSCEVTQVDRMRSAGFHIAYQDELLGQHGTEWTAQQVFERYRRLFAKREIYSKVGHDYEWLRPFPEKFIETFRKSGSLVDYWAHAGCIAGIAAASARADGERDARRVDDGFLRLWDLAPPFVKFGAMDRVLKPRLPSTGQYIEQRLVEYARPQSKLRICLVTAEFPGCGAYGGIGRAFELLAAQLASAGHKVVVGVVRDENETSAVQPNELMLQHNVSVRRIDVNYAGDDPNLAASWHVRDWLAERSFDVVHFAEFRGLGLYSLEAKRQGLGFETTRFVVQAHGPIAFLRPFQRWDAPEPQFSLRADYVERRSIELADTVVSPSRHLVDWMTSQGYLLPRDTRVIPNIQPPMRSRSGIPENDAEVNEIVCFGKQIDLKGIELFCSAIDRLELSETQTITFLGRPGLVEDEHSAGYIIWRARNWKARLRIVSEIGSGEAMEYVADPRRLTIIPSLIENSPYVVLECVAAGAHFIATNVGGTAELLEPDSRDQCLATATAEGLAEKIQQRFQKKADGRVAAEAAHVAATWLELHATPAKISVGLQEAALPPVTICVTHRNRPDLVFDAIESCRAQSYPIHQIVVVDDGSDAKIFEALQARTQKIAGLDIKIVRQERRGLGAARNLGARSAETDLIVFLDDDDVLLPNAVSTLVRARSASRADIVTCSYYRWSGQDRVLPSTRRPDFFGYGANTILSFFTNCFGPSVCLTSREAIFQFGGFFEAVDTPYEDWEFYLRATLRGASIEFCAEALFLYRSSPNSMSEASDHLRGYERVLRTIEDCAHPAQLAKLNSFERHRTFVEEERKRAWAKIDQRPNRELYWALNKAEADAGANATLIELLLAEGRADTAADLTIRAGELQHLSGIVHSARLPGRRQIDEAKREAIDFQAAILLADRYLQTDPSVAVHFIQSALKGAPSSDPHVRLLQIRLARAYFDQGHIEEAIESLLEIQRNGEDLLVVQGLWAAFTALGAVALAEKYRKKADALEEEIYLSRYGDVEEAVRQGVIQSGRAHFLAYGKSEGRSWPMNTLWTVRAA